MNDEVRIAMIGLDTSHSIEFPRRMNAPDCREDLKVDGLTVVSCLRFPSPFQNAEGLDQRQKQLEEWGIPVTLDFDAAVADCDAIMLEINDPCQHLPYFERCAGLGKPLFLDKPPAESAASFERICDLAAQQETRFFTSSGMRFVPQLLDACAKVEEPESVSVFGALGGGPEGTTLGQIIVWYGIHTFEILNRAMGRGAESVFVKPDRGGAVATVQYPGSRRGVVELSDRKWLYGGWLRDSKNAVSFSIDIPYMVHNSVTDQLKRIKAFFQGGEAPVALEDSQEIMRMLDAAARSAKSGQVEPV